MYVYERAQHWLIRQQQQRGEGRKEACRLLLRNEQRRYFQPTTHTHTHKVNQCAATVRQLQHKLFALSLSLFHSVRSRGRNEHTLLSERECYRESGREWFCVCVCVCALPYAHLHVSLGRWTRQTGKKLPSECCEAVNLHFGFFLTNSTNNQHTQRKHIQRNTQKT